MQILFLTIVSRNSLPSLQKPSVFSTAPGATQFTLMPIHRPNVSTLLPSLLHQELGQDVLLYNH